jgi:predicted DNA-binding protein (MmcQ/YjbR family)
MPKSTLERMRAVCLCLPEATEKLTWDDVPTFRVKDKIFALLESSHAAFWCKARAGFQELLVQSDEARYFVPPYLGGKGWVGMRLNDKPDWNAVAALIEESYRLVAPKRLALQLEDTIQAHLEPKTTSKR